MRNVGLPGLLGLLGVGCLGRQELPIAPGEASIDIVEGTWFQGARSSVWLSYPNATLCDEEDWSCVDPETTMTVVSATCNGCTFIEDPTGKIGPGMVAADAIASVDGRITIDATLRFGATGPLAQVTGSVTGDHEVALVATCALVDSAVLAASRSSLGAGDLRDCKHASTRRSNETVLVFPDIHTAHSGDFAGFCTSLDCRGARTVTTTPPAAAWGNVHDGYYIPFIAMPPLDPTTTAISLSLPLATGELSTLSLAVPPLAASR